MKGIVFLVLLFCSLGCVAQKRDRSIKVFEGRGVLNSSRKIFDGTGEGFRKFPVQASDTNLEVLILDNNSIEEIPNWIASCRKLRILSLRNNNLKELNPVIQNCENLEMLFLSGNPELTDLPSLGFMKKLVIVDVIDTGIHSVPTTMWGSNSLFYFKYTKPAKQKK